MDQDQVSQIKLITLLMKPSDCCTHLKPKLSSLNQIISNEGYQITMNKSHGLNNADLQELVKSGLLYQVNQDK